MKKLLKLSGIILSPKANEQLWMYHNLLRKRNDDRDLTRITGFEPMVIKHYIDCMIVGDLVKIPSPVIDIGTGAGFPGIPLKIRYPELKITLAEPRPRRVQFLKEVIKEIGLKNIEVFDHKVTSRSFQKPMQAVVTRALEEVEKTLARTQACLGIGGQFILLKGPNVDPELKEAEKRFPGMFKIILNKPYNLPKIGHERRLVVLEKLKEPSVPESSEAEEEYSAEGNQE